MNKVLITYAFSGNFANCLDPYPTTVSGADPAFLERGRVMHIGHCYVRRYGGSLC